MRLRLLGLAALWWALVAAAPTPLPFVPPPPDLSRLVPFATAPIEKPPAALPALAPPKPPLEVPTLPLVAFPRLEVKATAFLPAPRTLPCVGAWLRIASESLECGRARFGRGEFEEAARALEQAVRGGTDRDLLVEARYWLAETLYRLGRVEQADWLFRQVEQDAPRGDLAVFAAHGSGFTALELRDAARARDTFTRILGGPVPAPVDPWARHGQALANYLLGRHEEAHRIWAALATRPLPPALGRDVIFWVGESLGRIGQHGRAADELRRFFDGGAHPLADTARLRHAWWSLVAGRTQESLSAFRAFDALPGRGVSVPVIAVSERDWVDAGLALALAATGDGQGARDAARPLQNRRSALGTPVMLRLAEQAHESRRPADVRAIVQELLGGTLTPATRAWLLLINGDAERADGNRDDARTQYELAQRADAGSPTAWFAAFRRAQTNVEMREFAQAASQLTAVVQAPISPELRAAALSLQGDAAYHAGNHAQAAGAFRQVLVEFPNQPVAAAARLGLAWADLRQDRRAEARREFLAFAAGSPDDPHAPDALVLASELTLASGDVEGARQLLDRILNRHPAHPRAEFARLNRAILMIRTGQATAAEHALRDWVARAPFQPLLGRAHAALGVTLLAAARTAEASKEFAAAEREAVGAFASLGLGAAALQQAQWDAAAKHFGEARDNGTPPIVAAAEYGLAAVAFHRGAVREFKAPALAELGRVAGGSGTSRLLYVLTGIAIEEKDWPGALALAKRLVAELAAEEQTDDALTRVGTAAAEAGAWPVAREALATLHARYPKSPFVEGSRLLLAEAQLETGGAAEARPALERLATATPSAPRAADTWLALARAREATGDRTGALEAYARAARDGGTTGWKREALLAHARLLTEARRWSEARTVLEGVLKQDSGVGAAEAAAGIADTYRGEGESLAALEYYMTAAYLAPESPAGRRALVAAARGFTALRQPEAAAIVWKRLLGQSGLPAELGEAAREGLKEAGK